MQIREQIVNSDKMTSRLLAGLLLLHTYLLLSVPVAAQFDYETQPATSVRRVAAAVAAAGQPVPIDLIGSNRGLTQQNQWDTVNQALLDKCMQLQRMAMKKRNFGLEIPDIIMNRVQGGTEGNPALKEMRMRMMASGKRK